MPSAVMLTHPRWLQVHIISAACENMISGNVGSLHPGDILTSASGKTVEVRCTCCRGLQAYQGLPGTQTLHPGRLPATHCTAAPDVPKAAACACADPKRQLCASGPVRRSTTQTPRAG